MKDDMSAKSSKKNLEPELDFSQAQPLEIPEDTKTVASRPSISSPEWHNFVMSHFTKEELIDNCPTADGLRRVTELLLGPIIAVIPRVHQCPTPDNQQRATVSVEIHIRMPEFDVIYGDAVDSFPGNTDGEYTMFPVATATTRAEARCLRKALRLRKIIASEEKVNSAQQEKSVDAETFPEVITSSQIATINLMCGRCGININKFLAENQVPSLEKATFEDGSRLCGVLGGYIRDISTVPENLK